MIEILVMLIPKKVMLYSMYFSWRRICGLLISSFTKLIIGVCVFSFCAYADEWRTNPGIFNPTNSPFMGYEHGAIKTKLISGGKPILVNKNASQVFTHTESSGGYTRITKYWMQQYNTSVAAIKLEGSGYLSRTEMTPSQNTCYLIPAFYAVYRTSGSVISHPSNSMNSAVGVYYFYSQSIRINDRCDRIYSGDPRVSNVMMMMTPPSFYAAWGDKGRIEQNNFAVGDIFLMNIYRSDNFISSAFILSACPTNRASSMCTYFGPDRLSDPITPTDPVVTPVSCDLQRSDDFDFGTVTSDTYIGREKSIYLNIKCTGDASVKLSVVDANNLKLGPFKLEFLLNNSTSPVINVKENISTDVVAKGKITGAIDKVTAGQYEGSMIIITELN